MRGAVFIRPVGYPRFCRLLTIGCVTHVTACRARLGATEPVILTPTTPPPQLFCSACRAELEALRQRAATIDLGPCVRELGVAAALDVDDDDGGDTPVEWNDSDGAPGPDSAAIRDALNEHEDLLDVPIAPVDEVALEDLASDPAIRVRGRR